MFTRFLAFMALVALVVATPGVSLCGPNAGGVLIAHECQVIRTFSYDCALDACENADVQAEIDVPVMWKVWAAFPPGSSPRLKAFVMGSEFPASVIIEAAGLIDPVNDFEIAQNGWPYISGGGVAVSFAEVKTSIVNDVYWLAGYAAGQSGVWALTPHPVGATIFVDDAIPPAEDPVAGFGSLGFGVPGDAPCPPSIIAGACCFETGECILVTEAECAGLCGMWIGEGYSCDPNPCPPLAGSACCLPDGTCVLHWPNVCECLGGVSIPQIFSCDPDPCGGTPVEETTWGKIKARHR